MANRTLSNSVDREVRRLLPAAGAIEDPVATRRKILDFAYPDGRFHPWTWDLESRLPVELQDWSRFKGRRGRGE